MSILRIAFVIFLAFVCCLTANANDASSRTVSEWRSDVVNITFGGVDGIRPWNISVTAQANGEFFKEDVGHFRISMSTETEATGWVTGLSDCIELGSSMAEVTSLLSKMSLTDGAGHDYPLSSIMSIQIKKFGNGKKESSFRTTFEIKIDSSVAFSLSAELSFSSCSPLRTVGQWDDPENWVDGNVPNESSYVVFPVSSGVAILRNDTSFRFLDMHGGYIIAQYSGCIDGWSPFMTSTQEGYHTCMRFSCVKLNYLFLRAFSYKCLKLFYEPQTFEDSILTCKNSKRGAMDAQLVQIESYDERSAVLHMCRSGR